MKNLFLSLLAIACLNELCEAQCETRDYFSIAQKVANLQLERTDFADSFSYFLAFTIFDATDQLTASDYYEYNDPDSLKNTFYHFMKSQKWDGYFFNYYELIDNPFFSSKLHQSFLINDSTDTYMIDIWHNKLDFIKINGFTVVKLPKKLINPNSEK